MMSLLLLSGHLNQCNRVKTVVSLLCRRFNGMIEGWRWSAFDPFGASADVVNHRVRDSGVAREKTGFHQDTN